MKFTHRSIHFKYMWNGIEIFVLKKKKKSGKDGHDKS